MHWQQRTAYQSLESTATSSGLQESLCVVLPQRKVPYGSPLPQESQRNCSWLFENDFRISKK